MDTEIREVASRFERVNRAVIDAIERCAEDRLHAPCPRERCTVAALACHIADSLALGADWVRKVLAGGPLPPVTMDIVDRVNSLGFARDAYRTKREALERLRRDGAEAAVVIRSLNEADLVRSSPFALFGGPTTSVRELIERVLINGPESHLRSMIAAIGAASQPVNVGDKTAGSGPPDGG